MELDSAIGLELLNALLSDGPFVDFIFLVSHGEQYDVWFTLRHDLIVPGRKIVESFQTRHVVR